MKITKLINKAISYADVKHLGTARKYTGEPYVNHARNVAHIVSSVTDDEAVIAAAWLHDTLEDTATTYPELVFEFGDKVAGLVREVTKVSRKTDGDRATRKAIDRAHYSKASADGKTIKLADMIDNTRSIRERDPEFAKTYLPEKRADLAVLREGDSILYGIARSLTTERKR